jgi:Cu-processing system permease protein
VSGALAIAGYAIRESVRHRVFQVVLLLTVAFLVLFGAGVWRAFADTGQFVGRSTPFDLKPGDLAGATVFGLGMFATLFLGSVLAVFLTHGVVRGDADRGLLQPLVVRPVGRAAFLGARYLAGIAVSTAYVVCVYAIQVAITGAVGGWWPDRIVLPSVELAAAVAVVAALSLLGSIFLSATANGIAVFMLFGGGLVAGLLGSVGRAIGSPTLREIGRDAAWALPFEALYQDALHAITEATEGFTGFALRLGPFGGAQVGGPILGVWVAVYLGVIAVAAFIAFRRRDL